MLKAILDAVAVLARRQKEGEGHSHNKALPDRVVHLLALGREVTKEVRHEPYNRHRGEEDRPGL
jgi:non-canonical (house-cleaning) NTP pyrophosphatase